MNLRNNCSHLSTSAPSQDGILHSVLSEPSCQHTGMNPSSSQQRCQQHSSHLKAQTHSQTFYASIKRAFYDSMQYELISFWKIINKTCIFIPRDGRIRQAYLWIVNCPCQQRMQLRIQMPTGNREAAFLHVFTGKNKIHLHLWHIAQEPNRERILLWEADPGKLLTNSYWVLPLG